MSAQVQPRISPEQYLEIERAATTRSEYYNGRMFAMSGGTFNHARVSSNLLAELHYALKKSRCVVVSSDLRIRVAPDGLYTYPDMAVVCGKPEFVDGQRDSLVNPVLIVEVLSLSTEDYKRGFKAAQYRTLPSLKEYALVSQAEARIEIFRRQETGDWLLAECAGKEAICHFTSVNAEIALADIYDKVVFEPPDPSSPHPGY